MDLPELQMQRGESRQILRDLRHAPPERDLAVQVWLLYFRQILSELRRTEAHGKVIKTLRLLDIFRKRDYNFPCIHSSKTEDVSIASGAFRR
jgi:hypothetical protein